MRWMTVAVLCGSVCGCSSSEYDAAAARRLADYRVEGEFASLRPDATAVAGGQAELRLPAVLVNELDQSSPRATPPFIRDFPGFAAAYETLVDGPDARLPVVLTVGVADRRKDEVADAILRQVRQDEEFTKATWQKGREVVDRAGGSRRWDVLELAGAQPFQVEKADITDEKRLAGKTEVWLSADPAQKACVILVFRVPDDAAGRLPLPEISTLTARTVRVVGP